ncbi:MAG: magnesium/cobalt transporter CorA, partial [Clostridiales bacterium]|nr:magnesium/cobalt transporter CorA [Clostridiales bacterium]
MKKNGGRKKRGAAHGGINSSSARKRASLDAAVPRRSSKSGTEPGTLVHIGRKKTENVSLHMTEYSGTFFAEKELEDGIVPEKAEAEDRIIWLNMDGLHDTSVIDGLGKRFAIHPLVLEDILNTEQRAKIEDYGDYVFISVKTLNYNEDNGTISTEHQCILFGKDFVVSAGEGDSRLFDPIRERLKNVDSRIRKSGADFLAYSLLDAVIDDYFNVLEKLGDRIEAVEDDLLSKKDPNTFQDINALKRDMLYVHKSVWPLREVVDYLESGDTGLVGDSTHIYIRDLYDHIIQVMDTAETYRDILSGMVDIYLSTMSNRLNEIMKVLTIISTIFIPLTFMAGV